MKRYPRALRIEYPDAWYHVMNPGRHAESIFLDKKDFNSFFELVAEAAEMWNVKIAAYCFGAKVTMLKQIFDPNITRGEVHFDG